MVLVLIKILPVYVEMKRKVTRYSEFNSISKTVESQFSKSLLIMAKGWK